MGGKRLRERIMYYNIKILQSETPTNCNTTGYNVGRRFFFPTFVGEMWTF